MKKISIILAMAALGVAFTSCKQEDEPKYKAPNGNTTFLISKPAMQDVAFRTASDMTDEDTFNLFCSQPDYGYSAVCNYSVLVSMDAECPVDENGLPVSGKTVALPNENPTQAAMAIKTYELGVAVNKLLGYTSPEAFEAANAGTVANKCYFRAVCEIPGIEGSRIVSQNVTSLNAVYLKYAEKKPAWIYICGDVQTDAAGTAKNGFLAPGSANQAAYDENWALYEPNDKIGEKLFVGTFWLSPKGGDESNVDNCSQFRFFTKLVGWSTAASLGSNEADFYVFPITDKWATGTGYNGDIVDHGLGNWGIWCEEPKPFTVVVDVKDLKIYVKEGEHAVTFAGRNPEFN